MIKKLFEKNALSTHPRIDVDQRVRNPRRRLERRQQLVRHVLGLLQEQPIAGERVARQKSTDKPDVRLEHAQIVAHAVQRKLALDPVPALVELLVQPHQVQRVQPVDDGGAEVVRPEDAARVAPLGDGLELVLAPRVQLVIVPGVDHHLLRGEENGTISFIN